METSATRTIIEDFYDAFGKRDRARLWSIMADDIDWMSHTPVHVFSFSGWRRGRDAVIDSLRRFTKEYALEEYRQEATLVDGPRAAVISNSLFLQRATQRKLRLFLVDFTRFENGRLVEFRQFTNSFDLVEQALGREIDLGLDRQP